jgi:hypothetical protein
MESLIMFTKEQLEGIILSLSNPEISIEKDDNQSIGYRIRLRVHFRVTRFTYRIWNRILSKE